MNGWRGYRNLHTLEILTHSVLRILEKCLLLCNLNGDSWESRPGEKEFLVSFILPLFF